jgi:hypothetical protein
MMPVRITRCPRHRIRESANAAREFTKMPRITVIVETPIEFISIRPAGTRSKTPR